MSQKEFFDFINNYCGNVTISHINSTDKDKAHKINNKYNIRLTDSLHYIIAKKNKCNALITYNIKDFRFSKRLHILKPEDL